MACALTPTTHAGADFTGKAGAKVHLEVKGERGQAFIQTAVYAGQTLSAPWTIQLQEGISFLHLLIENPVPRDWTSILEICGPAHSNVLLRYRYDPFGPTQSFEIEGT